MCLRIGTTTPAVYSPAGDRGLGETLMIQSLRRRVVGHLMRGRGVAVDYAQAATWYRRAARHGSLAALFSLGVMHINDRILPRDDVEGLTLLLEAESRAMSGSDPATGFILEHQPAAAKRLQERMNATDIAKARQRAADRSRTPVPAGESE